MNRILWAVALLATATAVSAAPLSVSGKGPSATIAVISGTQGAVRLIHDGKVVREQATNWPYTAAIVLAGPLDSVEWDGKAATVVAGGADPVAVARAQLEGRSAPVLFFIKPDGSLEFEKAPAEGEDGESAATEE